MPRGRMPTPLSVDQDDAAHELVVTWTDNHVSRYAYRLLRQRCPCAMCVHEWTGERLLDPSKVAPDVRPKEVARVGAYALRFTWSDGHSTGIYPFPLLRGLCECEACVRERSAKS